MSDYLEEISTLIEPWQGQREAIRARAARWLASSSFQQTYYDDAHPPMAAEVLFKQSLKKAEAAQAWKQCQVFGIQMPELWNQYMDLGRHGHLVFAMPVIVNPSLAAEPNRSLPCLIVIPEDQSTFALASTHVTARFLGDIYAGSEQRYPGLQKLLQDDEFQLFRRRSLTRGEVSNVEARLYDVLLRLSWLPPAEIPFVPMLIQPGPKGAIVQIPWSVATGVMPALDSMPRGIWGEMADFDRAADELLKIHNAKCTGVGYWIRRVGRWSLFAIIGLGAIGALLEHFNPKPAPKRPAAAKATNLAVVWKQSGEVSREISVVSASEYEPLREGTTSRAFLLRVPKGVYLAVTPRNRQLLFSERAPLILEGPEKQSVLLDSVNVKKQQQLCIQLVTKGIGKNLTALPFQSKLVLQPKDELWVSLGKERRISGTFDGNAPHRLDSAPEPLKMKVASEITADATRGLPVIHGKTGCVVGMMLSVDGTRSPSIIVFETISLPVAGP